MVDLAEVATSDLITAARSNLIKDYIQDGTHLVNSLSLNIGGVTAIDSSVNNRLGKSTDTKTDSYTILTSDIAKTIVMNSASNKIIYLPSVNSTNIRFYVTIAKINSGTLTIQAADNDIIIDSGAGATIYNNESGETYATITLQLVSETKWVAVGGSGTWVTTT